METFQLYKTNTCCGCGACAAICSKNAITMSEDQFGFIYPRIDEDKCVDCDMCKKVCVFSTSKSKNTFSCYACANKNDNQIMNSASGGAFSAIASSFILSGGWVCGATARIENGIITVEHKIINKISDLPILQGSKYVQSNTLPAFKEIKKLLKKGEKVLFSGTPCQVDAIKSLCKSYVNKSLFTIDIICHGVPSQKFLNGYLFEYQKRQNATLTYIDFRNKKYGWGLTGIAKFDNNADEVITPDSSSYYRYFLDGEIYRQNCYECPYANMKRVGDITIGDYWGVQDFSPELNNKQDISVEKGVSCLIINSSSGHRLFDEFGNGLTVYPIEIEKVMVINTQLREPAKHTLKRDWLMETFAHKGYAPIEMKFQRQLCVYQCKNKIKRIIFLPIKNIVKKMLKKVIVR